MSDIPVRTYSLLRTPDPAHARDVVDSTDILPRAPDPTNTCTCNVVGLADGATAHVLEPALALAHIPEARSVSAYIHTPRTLTTGYTSAHTCTVVHALEPERVQNPSHVRVTTHAHSIDDTAILAPREIPVPSPSPVPMSSDTNENIFEGYLSDLEDDAFVLEEDDPDDWYNESHAPLAASHETPTGMPTNAARNPPVTEHSALKRHKLNVPIKEQRENARKSALEARIEALKDIKRLISSKRHSFEGGKNGLQAYHARAIQACLYAMVNQNIGAIEASQAAAVGVMMAKGWGGRQVRRWMHIWVKGRELPQSKRGTHAKTYSLVSDPIIRAELRSYMRSEKWAMDPAKLQSFLRKELPFAKAETYMQQILGEEMPQGLKHHFETVVLPRLHLRSNGISLSTIRRVMLEDGFAFTVHKKAIFYDGHERPDVVNDRQNRFIPEILALRPRIVRYEIGDVMHEARVVGPQPDGPRYVLVAHDESTAQANDGKKASWIKDGEQPIRKKGPGRGIHQSDFICSTHGWLADASETLEYGKNHEGFWNGSLFLKQVGFHFASK